MTESEVHRVAVRPPPFWRNRTKLWFYQLEAQFVTGQVTADETKYNIVVAALDEVTLDFVVDILSDPPAENKYDALKQALISRLTDSEESQLLKLFSDLELGDRRPSDLLRHMKSLAGKSVNQDAIRSLWLKRLPPHVQAILQISKDPIDSLAEMADKVMNVYNPPEMFTVERPTSFLAPQNSDASRLDALEAKIHALSEKLDLLLGMGQVSRSREREGRSPNPRQKSKFCWLHLRFGQKANRCISPCDFPKHTESSPKQEN